MSTGLENLKNREFLYVREIRKFYLRDWNFEKFWNLKPETSKLSALSTQLNRVSIWFGAQCWELHSKQ